MDIKVALLSSFLVAHGGGAMAEDVNVRNATAQEMQDAGCDQEETIPRLVNSSSYPFEMLYCRDASVIKKDCAGISMLLEMAEMVYLQFDARDPEAAERHFSQMRATHGERCMAGLS